MPFPILFWESRQLPWRFQVYGSTLKALVHEKLGDGILSAFNFELGIQAVDDPEGGKRAVITLNGKYLPTKPL